MDCYLVPRSVLAASESGRTAPRQRIGDVCDHVDTLRTYPGWYYSNVHTADGHAKPSECVKCGKCERECPQGLPIRRLLDELATKFE